MGPAAPGETTPPQVHEAVEGALKDAFHSLRKCVVNRAGLQMRRECRFQGGRRPLAGLSTRSSSPRGLGPGDGGGPPGSGASSLCLAATAVALAGSG